MRATLSHSRAGTIGGATSSPLRQEEAIQRALAAGWIGWLPGALVVLPLALSFAVWSLPEDPSGLGGFSYRTPPFIGTLLVILLHAAAVSVVAGLALKRGLARGGFGTIRTLDLSTYQRVCFALGGVGVGWVYYQVTGGNPGRLSELWSSRSFNEFGVDYVDYGPGVTTARYATVVAAGIALSRLVAGQAMRTIDYAALGLLGALALATSRISVLLAVAVAVALLGLTNVGGVRWRRVLLLGAAVAGLFVAAGWSRAGDLYHSQGVTDPLEISLRNAQAYLATPAEVTVQLLNASGAGTFTAPGGLNAAVGAITPSYLAGKLWPVPDSALEAGYSDVEARYTGAVDLTLGLTTNSVLADTLARYGWGGVFAAAILAGLAMWLAGRLMLSGASGIATSGVLLYGLAEYWRTYLYATGGMHALVILLFATAWLTSRSRGPGATSRPQAT